MSVEKERCPARASQGVGPILRFLSAALACWLVAACSCTNKHVEEAAAVMASQVRVEMKPLTSVAPGKPTDSQRAFLKYYEIKDDLDHYRFGTFESGGVTLAAHLFRSPRRNRGTAIIVHGYLDHTGTTSSLINRLRAEGYSVAVYDQRGHGLSGGQRVSVHDFSDYQAGFSDFFQLVRRHLPPPYDVVGHSMGATVVTEHLLVEQRSPLRRIIFLAPVIRDALPAPLQILGRAVSPVIDHLPRVALGSSSDPNFEDRMKGDPLRTQCVSTRWSRALHRWMHKFGEYPPCPRSPLIINAEFENVVDLDFSTAWMIWTFVPFDGPEPWGRAPGSEVFRFGPKALWHAWARKPGRLPGRHAFVLSDRRALGLLLSRALSSAPMIRL